MGQFEANADVEAAVILAELIKGGGACFGENGKRMMA